MNSLSTDIPYLLNEARAGLVAIGYNERLVRTNYSFADVLADSPMLREISLAAFAQEPPSYRTACVGIAVPQTEGSEAILGYRALGAPYILALHPDRVVRWQVGHRSAPRVLEEFAPERLRSEIIGHGQALNPMEILRAKSFGLAGQDRQLDLFDIGFLPWLESIVHEKLDQHLDRIMSAVQTSYRKTHQDSEFDPRMLFRLIFRLLAAKLLSDRDHPGGWNSDDVQVVLRAVDHFYFQSTPPEVVLHDLEIQQLAWSMIREGLHLQNLSVEALAYVYENTFVTTATRRLLGTHATPPPIAEYMVRQLPFEMLAQNERRVFEPFAGHAPFLVAALGRLRTLLSAETTINQRHEYFVQMLTGMEIDSFAREVARYSLILADYPNSNGWQISHDDVFGSTEVAEYLEKAAIVLCNPPFESFALEERALYGDRVLLVNKAAEALRRVLESPPLMLGFVLPRTFVNHRAFRELRLQVAETYNNTYVLVLPDKVFRYSQVEVVILLAYNAPGSDPIRRTGEVKSHDYQNFLRTGMPTWEMVLDKGSVLWGTPLHKLWDSMIQLPSLGQLASIHVGLQYNIGFDEGGDRLTSTTPKPGFRLGLKNVTKGFEPYLTQPDIYLSMDPSLMRRNAHTWPWAEPKIIANRTRRSRGTWTIQGAIDREGLVCYQNFFGIWPKTDEIPLEVLAAVINHPVANAFVSSMRASRDNLMGIVKRIPIPVFTREQMKSIVALVRDYTFYRKQWIEAELVSPRLQQLCRDALLQIDAEIFMAYDLSPFQTHEILESFVEHLRPGPVHFGNYVGEVMSLLGPPVTLDDLMSFTSQRMREIAAERDIDWDSLSEDERQQFLNDLLHEG